MQGSANTFVTLTSNPLVLFAHTSSIGCGSVVRASRACTCLRHLSHRPPQQCCFVRCQACCATCVWNSTPCAEDVLLAHAVRVLCVALRSLSACGTLAAEIAARLHGLWFPSALLHTSRHVFLPVLLPLLQNGVQQLWAQAAVACAEPPFLSHDHQWCPHDHHRWPQVRLHAYTDVCMMTAVACNVAHVRKHSRVLQNHCIRFAYYAQLTTWPCTAVVYLYQQVANLLHAYYTCEFCLFLRARSDRLGSQIRTCWCVHSA